MIHAYHKAILVILWGLLVSQAAAQTCVQQPPPALRNVSEFACKDMTYEAAWDLLVANNVNPIRPAKVAELGADTNRKSRKHLLITGLRIASFGLPFVGGLGNISEEWLKGLFAAAPGLIEGGLQFAQGVPDDFRETPAEAGFVTVYAATSNVGSIGVKSAPVPAPAPASFIPRFQVSTWKVLLEETAAGRRETIARWRAIDTSWSIEEIPAWRESQIQEAQGRMNFHEVELLAEAR